jgi:hypothetical protein
MQKKKGLMLSAQLYFLASNKITKKSERLESRYQSKLGSLSNIEITGIYVSVARVWQKRKCSTGNRIVVAFSVNLRDIKIRRGTYMRVGN